MSRRFRTIKASVLLEDESAAELSDAAWRLWVGVRMLADDFGVFRAGDRYLAAQVWQDTSRAKRIAALLEELRGAGKIALHRANDAPFGSILGWDTEQRIDNRSEKTRLPGPTEEFRAVAFDSAADLPDPPRTVEARGEPGKVAARARARAVQPPEGDTDLDLGSGRDPDRASAHEAPSGPEAIVVPRVYGAAYVRGIEAGTGLSKSMPSGADLERLTLAIDAHARRPTGERISRTDEVIPWLEAQAADFGRTADAFGRRCGFAVHAFVAWLDGRGAARPGVQPAAKGGGSWTEKNPNVVNLAAGAATAKGPEHGVDR